MNPGLNQGVPSRGSPKVSALLMPTVLAFLLRLEEEDTGSARIDSLAFRDQAVAT